MAYMDQKKKAKIAEQLKKVIPKSWKYSLAVHHHSTIILTFRSAPVDLIAECKYEDKRGGHVQVNEFYLDRAFDGEVLAIMTAAKAALNLDNFDKSDIQTDYFHVGHYVSINVGAWDKPFVVASK